MVAVGELDVVPLVVVDDDHVVDTDSVALTDGVSEPEPLGDDVRESDDDGVIDGVPVTVLLAENVSDGVLVVVGD